MLSPIMLICVALLALAFLMPSKKKGANPLQQVISPERFSIREQQLAEDAEAIAGEYRRSAYEAYLADLRKTAAKAFQGPSGA